MPGTQYTHSYNWDNLAGLLCLMVGRMSWNQKEKGGYGVVHKKEQETI